MGFRRSWRGGRADTRCLFCNLLAATAWAVGQGMSQEDADRAAGIVLRGERCFVCLNRYPYSAGHVMIVPVEHCAGLAGLNAATAQEMMRLAQQTERVLRAEYKPDGLNYGINIDKAAGAGVAGHVHWHAVPRWMGDTNFMTVTAETRVMPEDLARSWKRLREAYKK